MIMRLLLRSTSSFGSDLGGSSFTYSDGNVI